MERGEQEDPYPEVAGMQSWMPEMATLLMFEHPDSKP